MALISSLQHVPPPVPWLDHVHLSSSQTVSCATLQIPGCIMCSPPIPWLYQYVLPFNSKTVSRVPKCITCSQMYHVSKNSLLSTTLLYQEPPTPYIPFGDTWRGKLSFISPFVTFIDFTLSSKHRHFRIIILLSPFFIILYSDLKD